MTAPGPDDGKRSLLRSVLLGAVVIVLGACAGAPGSSSLLRTELFFGLNKPDGDTVSTREWQAFVDTCITRVFPAGCTIADAAGWWRSEAGTPEKERSKILILIHADDNATDSRVEYVRRAYKAAFRQESVLRVTIPVQASF